MACRALKVFTQPRKAINYGMEKISYGHRKAIGYGLMYGIYWSKRLRVRDYVIVSPVRPRRAYSLWKLAKLSGIKMVAENEACGPARRRPFAHAGLRPLARIRHHDDTWDDRVRDGFVNGRCTDISKSRVDAIFEQVFGYATRIDPTRFVGRCVIKAERNFSGGGKFVDCPIKDAEVDPDFIYQKLVDNLIEPDVVREFRVAIVGGEITDVIVQSRSVERRLKGRGSGGGRGSTICRAEDVFSPSDINRIHRFCALLGMDFGELDVLPDVNEGRLYILDANKTPTYMSRGATFRVDRFRTLLRRAEAFERLVRRYPAMG